MKIKNFLLISGLTALSILTIPSTANVSALEDEDESVIKSKLKMKVVNEVNLNLKYKDDKLSIPIAITQEDTHYVKINENGFNTNKDNIQVNTLQSETNQALLTAKFNKNVNNTIKLVLNHKKNFFESLNIFHNSQEEIVVKLTSQQPTTINSTDENGETNHNVNVDKSTSANQNQDNQIKNDEFVEDNLDSQFLEYKLENIANLESIAIEYEESSPIVDIDTSSLKNTNVIDKDAIYMEYQNTLIEQDKFDIIGESIVISKVKFSDNKYVKLKINEDIELVNSRDNTRNIRLTNEASDINNLMETNKVEQETQEAEETTAQPENIANDDLVPQNPVLNENVNCDKPKEIILPEQEGVIYSEDIIGNKIKITATNKIGYAFKEGAVTTWEFDITPIPCAEGQVTTPTEKDTEEKPTDLSTNTQKEETQSKDTKDNPSNGVIVSLGENLNIVIPVALGVLGLSAGTVLVVKRIRKN